MAGDWMQGLGPVIGLHNAFFHAGMDGEALRLTENTRQQELVAIGQDLQSEATAYMARHGHGAPEFSPGVVYELMRRSSAKELPAEIKAKVAFALGLEPDGIRIHVDSAAAQAAKQINARAFTVGEDIYFARGQWQPGTQAGEHLLLHEATHVKQHREGRLNAPVGGGMQVSVASDATEVEAERMAAQGTAALQDVNPADLSLDGALDMVDLALDAGPVVEGATEEAPEAAEAQQGGDLVAHRDPDDDDDQGSEGVNKERRKEKELVDEIDIDAAIQKAITPIEEADKQREEIKAHKDATKDAPTTAVPADGPEKGEGEDAPKVDEKPREKVELSLEDPATIQATVQSDGIAPPDLKCEFALTTAVPSVQVAFQAYIASAGKMLIEIGTRGAKVRRDVKTAITTAKGGVTGEVTRLQGEIARRHGEAAAKVDQGAEKAHAKLRELRDKRKVELKTEYDRIYGQLKANSKSYRGTLVDHTKTKAKAIEAEGNRIAQEVESYAKELAATALVHGEGIAQHWATPANWSSIDNDYEDELASDVGKYARNTAKKAANKILKASTDLVEDIKEDGVDLREDLQDHGDDYVEEFDDKVEEVEETWDGGVEAAQGRIDQSYEESKHHIDDAARDAKEKLKEICKKLSDALGTGGQKMLDAFDKGAQTADEALASSIQDAVDGISTQIQQVVTWVQESHPSQWPEVCETLRQLQAEVEADTPTFATKIEGIGQEIITAITGGGGEGNTALGKAFVQMDAKITEFESGIEAKLVAVAVGIDTDVFAARVKAEKDDWEAKAKTQDDSLKKAKDDSIVELDKEFDEGKTNLEEKRDESKEELKGPYDSLKESLAGDCRFMAESPWRARMWNFAKGLGRALLTFLKVLGILVLVVLVIAAIVAAIFGWAAVVAAGLAVLGFLAAHALAVAIIAGILTAIGIILALIPAIAASLDDSVSSFEAWDAWGEFAGTVLVEIAELAFAKMTKAGTFAKLFGQADEAVDAIKAVDGGIDSADALSDVANAAGKTDEFVDLATGADKMSGAVGDTKTAVNTLEGMNDAAEGIVDTGRAIANTQDAIKAGTDLAKADEVVDVAVGAGKVEDAVDSATDVGKAQDALDSAGDSKKVKDAVEGGTDGEKATEVIDAASDTTTAAKVNPAENVDDAYKAAEASGYGKGEDAFKKMWEQGKRFDEVSRRWVKPDNVTQWAEFLGAQSSGYSGAFKTFREQMRAGRHFDLANSRWVKPDDAAQWAAYLQARASGFAQQFTKFRGANRAGKVWDAASGSFKSAEELAAAAKSASKVEDAVDVAKAGDGAKDGVKAADDTPTTKAPDTENPKTTDPPKKKTRVDGPHEGTPPPKAADMDKAIDAGVDVVADAARVAAEAEIALQRMVLAYGELKGLDALVTAYYDMLKVINNALTLGPDGEPIAPTGVEDKVKPELERSRNKQKALQDTKDKAAKAAGN